MGKITQNSRLTESEGRNGTVLPSNVLSVFGSVYDNIVWKRLSHCAKISRPRERPVSVQ
jgi:hypothetical protein